MSGLSSRLLAMRNNCMESEMAVVDRLTITKTARAQLAALVERAERITGSRMAAYQQVAMQIGRDHEWVRHFCNDYPSAKLDCTVLNIGEAFRRAGNADGAT